jgi:hypothetical protein
VNNTLAAAREIKINGNIIANTPAIVPSFSSKGFPEVDKIITALSETMSETGILISAYDIAKKYIKNLPKYPAYFILDSGGYECSDYRDLSDNNTDNYGYAKHSSWTQNNLKTVLDQWNNTIPTLSVSYDHPKARFDVKTQVENALKQFQGRNLGKLILIKPNTEDSIRINVNDVITNIREFHQFDVIGFTEKELGYSIFNRMENIAKIRRSLSGVGINIPIHIFGSLDTISTPLYFLSGADIFDGLTWLRYYYEDNGAVYMRNASALKYGTIINDIDIPPKIWAENYQYLVKLNLKLKRYIREKSCDVFEQHSKFFQDTISELYANIGD